MGKYIKHFIGAFKMDSELAVYSTDQTDGVFDMRAFFSMDAFCEIRVASNDAGPFIDACRTMGTKTAGPLGFAGV